MTLLRRYHIETSGKKCVINCYIEAERLDPDSPAVEAKRMLLDNRSTSFYPVDGLVPPPGMNRSTPWNVSFYPLE